MHSVGRYRVIRRIGAGSFSTVWLAHDDALDIEVAVKVLSDNWVEHADVRQRFIDEARLLRRIQDPRIVAVHDIGRLPDGRDYFVMDHAAGGTVADLASSPLPTATVLQLGADLADAVAALHANGVLQSLSTFTATSMSKASSWASQTVLKEPAPIRRMTR